MSSTIGAELELTLVGIDNRVKNNASEILNDPRIIGKGCYTYEGTEAQIEINSSPANTVHELSGDINNKTRFLEAICREYGSFPVPVSEFGAGRGEPREGIPRCLIYAAVFGKKPLAELLTNSGIHLHISQILGKELQQFYLLQALDPLCYAITSTSPINYRGVNSLNCHRINIQRNIAFENLPLFSQLQDYPDSLEALEKLDYQRWEQLQELAVTSGIDPETFKEIFKPDNTGYHSVRKRDKIGPTGTFEVRNLDICPSDIRSAAFALIKGVHDYGMSRGIQIAVADRIREYSLNDRQFVLPNIDTLKESQEHVIEDGLKPDFIFNYLFDFLPFAEQGLPKEDQQYLKPFQEMYRTRMNPADYIMRFMREEKGYTDSKFSPEQSAQANLFMREQYLKSLKC